ncbi:NAD(P)/FAD-dependent oxidoreductase [Ramlibacter terrae]|uniref:NAD(P)/FAD-dependent oxidoreductase n=1 Tax=Ramlibacter terrae TaxID=2732511 RepID=A0ABX6P1Q8_9BURK|nr:NAD(P)/FAD-dependent oxidoreductase [Ramlibacter terrae]
MNDDLLDCLVIGGGAAGLTAAVYFGRYRRRVLVLDDDESRLKWIPRTRNVLGFPDGIEGPDLLERMREHARRYAVPTERVHVEALRKEADGSFVAEAGGRRWRARFALLATGARDVVPDVEGFDGGLRAGQVRFCPVCDGFETQGKKVAVLGQGAHGLRESLFISNFGNEVTLAGDGFAGGRRAAGLAQLREAGVRIAESAPRQIACGADCGVRVTLQNGQVLEFDTLYPALGLAHKHDLATALGARAQPDGQLEVDAHQQTSVEGLYAAGDVAVDLNQIAVAAGHAAIAATAIHNRL